MAACRYCGNASLDNAQHVYGERKCCPDCDHRPYPQPPYCDRCEWDGAQLVSRCFTCRREGGSVADLLAPDEADAEPFRFVPPGRPSTLKGRRIPRRGHGASEGDPSL